MNSWQRMSEEQREESIRKRIATRKKNTALRKEEEQVVKDQALNIKYRIAELNKELGELEFKKLIVNFNFGLDNYKLPYPEHILKKAKPINSWGGVYFLIKESDIVYVGQSVNVFSRLQQHMSEKDFDKFTYLPLPKLYFDKVESFYIHMLRPKLNGKLGNNTGRLQAPQSLEEVINFKSDLFDMMYIQERKKR